MRCTHTGESRYQGAQRAPRVPLPRTTVEQDDHVAVHGDSVSRWLVWFFDVVLGPESSEPIDTRLFHDANQ